MNSVYLHHIISKRHLRTSRSFSHLPAGNKFTRMLGRKTLNTAASLSSLFPNKTISSISTTHKTNRQQQQEDLIHLPPTKPPPPPPLTTPLPPPPIENNPHVFDLLSKDSSCFIHFAKSDTAVTSATVEKLVEKLTREMGMFVCN